MISKMQYKIILLVSVLLIANNQMSFASEWSGQVSIETRLFTESAAYSEQHSDNSSIAFQPEFYHEFGSSNESITFVPYIHLDQHDHERSHADIRELTWLKVVENIEWRIGIRKVFWGVTESQHLVDIINQTDAIDSPDGEDKLGQPMFNLSYITDLGTFDAFVLPYFRERTFAGKKGRLRSEPYIDSATTFYESTDRKKNIDYAFRWSHSIEEWDLGLSYFTGTSRDPRFVAGNDQNGDAALHPYYDLIQQYGIDFQATYNSWLWKLEGIHRSGIGGAGDSKFNAVTAGIEYTFYSVIGDATDIGLIFEYLYDDRGDAATTPFQNDFLAGLRFNLNDEQSSEALIGVIQDIDSDATIYTIEASRRLTQHIKLSVEVRQYKNIAANEALYSYLKDDYIQFELAYFF